MIKDVQIINSFGGSILAACMKLRVPVRGSFETSGYGLEVQKYNAPKLRYVAETKDWPAQDLSHTLVIGHPPCSAFSTLNTAMRQKMGENADASVTSKAFECTRKLLDYAMGNGAAMVMVESVPKAMTEAKAIHDEYAQKFGYSIFRIVQNARNFGLPQDRKRFWVVYVKGGGQTVELYKPNVSVPKIKDVVKFDGYLWPEYETNLLDFKLRLQKYTTLSELVDHRIRMSNETKNDRLKQSRLQKALEWNNSSPNDLKFDGMTPEFVEEIFAGKHGYSKLPQIVEKVSEKFHDAYKWFLMNGSWDVNAPTMLNPEGDETPVVLASSLWLMDGKLLTLNDYKRIMGFPDWYGFPTKVKERAGDALGYLSRGVCPPVVEWLIRQFAGADFNLAAVEEGTSVTPYPVPEKVVMTDGGVLDLTGTLPTKPKTERVARPKREKTPEVEEVNPDAPECCVVEWQ